MYVIALKNYTQFPSVPETEFNRIEEVANAFLYGKRK